MSEVFYDSLEEDGDSPRDRSMDLAEVVPLYAGEVPKTLIAPPKKSKSGKKLNTAWQIPKKSYLAMYYQRQNGGRTLQNGGSCTSRAVCGDESPDRLLDDDLQSVPDHGFNEEDSCEEFYENILAEDFRKATSNVANPGVKMTSSKSCSGLTAKTDRFYLGSGENSNDKLKMLKKRQSYGTKMSKKNRIRIEELKSLNKIKSTCKLARLNKTIT